MADFSIREVEGMRQVRIEIAGETVRARRGAMSTLRGDIQLTPRLPGVRDIFRSIFTDEARIRPYYSGSGSIMLQPSLSGYHLMDVGADDAWVLEPGVYWASEGNVALGMRREPFWASFWAGDGFFTWKTTLRNPGRVAINAPGPVEVVDVDGELRVQGRLVLGRTEGLRFSSRPAARFPRSLISGQKRLRVYTGKGKALVCWTPYWNEHLYRRMTGESIEGSLFE
ncbi:AIM24 family protein [Falsirhodobacter xinxiangensis]|uniref:AIM24 family protein n=1 Tax=Falsirhodobacter xinxiangensis TaxID=2530049 RepID=UPI0010AAD57A|nr:AIM24 family protein [Rhodobacter xinxiangensis]